MEQMYTRCYNKEKLNNEAKYILRFDDVCPTMNWDIWGSVEKILYENDIKPIVAVVPNNGDKKLKVDNEKKDFWDKVSIWQAGGWSIALHGYDHIYVNSNSGIMRITKQSEFATLPYSIQKEKISKGIDVFKSHGIKTNIWVAPSHSFDKTTLTILKEFRINIISDGFSKRPFLSQELLWIPCQLWNNIKYKRNGLWTVCFHINSWSKKDIIKFEREVKELKDKIISVNDIQEYELSEISILDYLTIIFFTINRKCRIIISKILKRIL